MTNVQALIRCSVLIPVILISVDAGGGGRSNRFEMINEIRNNVKLILSSLATGDGGSQASQQVGQQLRVLAEEAVAIRGRVEALHQEHALSRVDSNRSNEQMLRLDQRLKSVEELLKGQLATKLGERLATVEGELKDWRFASDGKLRKMMNVLTSLYEIAKDVQQGQARDRSQGAAGASGDPLTLVKVKRAIREAMSVLSLEVKDQLGNLGATSVGLQSQLDTISGQVLLVQDDLSNRMSMMDHHNHDAADAAAGDHGSEGKGAGLKCPALNTSEIVAQVNDQQKVMMAQVSSKLDKISDQVKKTTERSGGADPFLATKAIPQSLPPPPAAPMPFMEPLQSLESSSSSRAEPRSLGRSIRPVSTRSAVRTGCTTNSAVAAAQSCWQIYSDGGATCDGVYMLMLQYKAFRVYCEMQDNGGGWTVIMRRGEFSPRSSPGGRRTDFNVDWMSYKEGFGELTDEFWLGNEHVHQMTSGQANVLQVDLESFDGQFVTFEYEHFRVGAEADDYRLTIGRPVTSSSAYYMAATMLTHNNTRFSTVERGSGNGRTNCADRYSGGWWFGYNKCYNVLLTGKYYGRGERAPFGQGIRWPAWKKDQSLKAVQMRIRPK